MKGYHPELVMNADTYEDMIGQVTDYDYFKKSKYLRQVIFGNLMPKRQQKIQKYVISEYIELFNEKFDITDIKASPPDEFVFEYVDGMNFDDIEIDKFCKYPFTIEKFTLQCVENRPFFVKEYDNGKIEFKGVPSYLFMQVYKKYLDEPINYYDRLFYYEGYMATFNEDIFQGD